MFKMEKGIKISSQKMDVCISAETIITGDIQTKSNLRVDGQIKGDINASGNVYIGNNAKVEGNVSGMDIQIVGMVNGKINATGELMIYSSGKLNGEIKATGIRVEKGTKYEGMISIGATNQEEVVNIGKLKKPTTDSK